MAQKRGLIEIRLDRRQAFYAVVGSLLIVSVAFVVGLIGGQRMQLSAQDQPATAGKHAVTGALDEREPPEPAVSETETYTFYEELAEAPPRPLLMPSSGGIGQPEETYRVLDRSPNVETLLEPPEDDAPPAEAAPTPAPARAGAEQRPVEPVAAPEPAPAPVRSEPPAQATSTPAPPPPATDQAVVEEPPVTPRRRLVRVDPEPAEAVDDFGYYTVVAGLFQAFGEANELRNQLRQAGHEAIVTIVSTGGPDRQYRVQVGSFTRRHEASEVAADLSRLGLRASVEQEG